LKGAVLDWITPSDTGVLNPPIRRNNKSERGFNHETTGFLLCPTEYDWANPEYVMPHNKLYFDIPHLWSRVKRQLQSFELPVKGDQWPIFLYRDYSYNRDKPWEGLLRSTILVQVSFVASFFPTLHNNFYAHVQAYKHIFMSPSSVEKENKATRSGNAYIHGMTSVTFASLAYIATQVGQLSMSLHNRLNTFV
jgi:hypothetical protein